MVPEVLERAGAHGSIRVGTHESLGVTSTHFRYAEAAPPVEVADWVLSFWRFEVDELPGDGPPYTVWPDGCVSVALLPLGVPGPGVLLTGPRVTAMRPPLRAHTRLTGIRLWPDVCEAVLGVAPRALRDAVGPAPSALAARFAPLQERLTSALIDREAFATLGTWVREQAASWTPPDAQVRLAVRAIVAARGEVAMPDVARESALGLRQLQRRFAAATGLTLREWARVRRLRESLALHMGGVDGGWSEVAAAAGFADHAHLTREFVALTGLPPSVAAKQLGATRHDDVRP
jgi:AraC-like DNA-binding protein